MLTALLLALALMQTMPDVVGPTSNVLALRYIDVAIGTGPVAAPGQRYFVHYTGWFPDGKKFDSSLDRKKPLDFVQGRQQVIAGWDLGFAGMRVGGKRRLFVPYQLAYGEKGVAEIPPRSDLIFDVELMDVKDAPPQPVAVDVILPLAEYQAKVMSLARAVPEEKYSWRPAADVRSFGEVFLHIAQANRMFLEMASGTAPAEDTATGKAVPPKAEILALLAQSFADVRKAMDTGRGLNREMQLFGETTTRRGIFTALDNHIAEHLGQAIAYARMNGIAPPWSQGKQVPLP